MRRVAELDAVRGIAAIAIMVNHLPFSGRLAHMGAYGVDLFFVLSGYLITTIILGNAGSRGFLAAFYARRSLRIWPIYYLAMLAVIAVNPVFRPPFRLDGWPYYAAYLQGIQGYGTGPTPSFTPLFDHTWTLALEEQYYLIWPALILIFGRRSVGLLAVALTVVPAIARGVGYGDRLLIGRCDGFALGGLLAVILVDVDRARLRTSRYVGGFVAVIAAAVVVWAGSGRIRIPGVDPAAVAGSIRLLAVSACFFGFVGILIFGAGSRPLAILRDPTLCYLGRISYGIYLYHYPIYWVFDATTDIGSTPWGIAAKFAMSLGVAALSWRFIERPILGLKDRFRYRPAGEAAT